MLNNIRELIPNKRPNTIREFIQKTFIIKFIRKIREPLSNGMLNVIITLILRTAPNTIREFIPNKIFFYETIYSELKLAYSELNASKKLFQTECFILSGK